MTEIPQDMGAQISELLGQKLTWKEIGQRLGFEPRSGQRRFSEQEDDIIREEWAKNTPLQAVAQMLGRDYGTVRQRIFWLKIRGRDKRVTRLVRRYGAEIVKLGDTPDQIVANAQSRISGAEAAAKAAATDAKAALKRHALDTMNLTIAAGGNRDNAIFNCRAAGVKLREISEEIGCTRERIRQICAQVAFARAMEAASGNGSAQ